jgi:hypothetical protein
MDWFWIAVAAYWIGQVISLLEMRAEHPDWQLGPCVLASLAWPMFAVRRFIARARRQQPSQW